MAFAGSIAFGPMPKSLWDQPVDTITDATAREMVLQLWKAIPKTAARVRAQLGTVMDYAEAHDKTNSGSQFLQLKHLKPVLPGKDKAGGAVTFSAPSTIRLCRNSSPVSVNQQWRIFV